MRTTLLIAILFYIGTWALVWGFPEISAHYPGGGVWFTGTLTVGALLGCIITDIIGWFRNRNNNTPV